MLTGQQVGEHDGRVRRGRPLWQHALALLILLTALATLVGTKSAFVTDESYVVIQLDAIEDTGRWTLPHPFPEVDPGGAVFPLDSGARFEDGYTLYGKHALLVYLYLPVHRAFGLAGLVGLSVLGTVGAALMAALLAERIRQGSGLLALWLVGVASPLFFDAFLIHAHTLAAALAAMSAYLALRAVEDRRVMSGVAALVATYAVALLRTEGVLFAAALGATIGVYGLLRRRPTSLLLGLGGLAAGVGAYLTDRAWSQLVADSRSVSVEPFDLVATTYILDRATSLTMTSVMPGYRGLDVPEVLTIVGAVLLVSGVFVLRRRPDDRGAVLFPGLGAGLLLVRSVLEWGAVPGLVVAFCVGAAGLVVLGGGVWRARETRFLLFCVGVFVVAVAFTQGKSGGHTEWGGRYFALAVPLLGSVAAASLSQALATWARPAARVLRACLLTATLALGVLAARTVDGAHDRNRARSDGVLAAAADLPPAADGLPPVVVTEDDQIPRLARGRYAEVRFLNVPSPHVPTYLERLAREEVQDLLLVSLDPAATLARIPPSYERVGPILPHPLQWEDGGGLIRLHLVRP